MLEAFASLGIVIRSLIYYFFISRHIWITAEGDGEEVEEEAEEQQHGYEYLVS